VEGNQLLVLPSAVFNLPKLHTLNASKNKLTELPDALDRAGELHVLNVGFNQLQVRPPRTA
jgi:Leucine-rich repeat (LRR) protein